MNWLLRTAARKPAAHPAFVHDTVAVPVRDVQWNRPVFRPPALTAHPPLLGKVPFAAMNPLRPTRR